MTGFSGARAGEPGHSGAWQRVEDTFFRLLELLLVLLLVGMVVMVFGNVVLRWQGDWALSLGFRSPLPDSILISEEMSRFFFVWLTFIGAVVVMREHAHLGVDALVRMLGNRGRFVCMVLSDLLVLGCCVLFFWGTWRQAPLNATNVAPVSGLNMLWVFGIGFFTSLGIGLMVAGRLFRALTGRLGPQELQLFVGASEGAEALKGRLE
jgi:TRAP-type C4-dicarboxylate transport system permease small subunit